ncbi:MAG: hypothetical protein GF355_13285, partial [Candidatus Eisenbacteria bacterium]|nr:hypothetical protein [Candidatus Eisenbacteria bacterium]
MLLMRRADILLRLAAALLLLLAGRAGAFHDGGVAACTACHTMHNSEDGVPVDPDAPSGNPWLLRDATPSDVCLSCHADHIGAVFAFDPLAPPPEKGAGNFVFLLEDNLNDGPGGAGDPIPGDDAGHNLVAPSRGVGPDATHTVSPGGSFPANQMGCTSCHDPHGNGIFRHLLGVGPVMGGVAYFTNPAPQAEGIDLFTGEESNSLHTAYRSGMSDWCKNCHADIHHGGMSPFHHNTDRPFGRRAASHYNR